MAVSLTLARAYAPANFRLAHPPRQPEVTPPKGLMALRSLQDLHKDQPDFHRNPLKKPKIPLDSASYKLYYVN